MNIVERLRNIIANDAQAMDRHGQTLEEAAAWIERAMVMMKKHRRCVRVRGVGNCCPECGAPDEVPCFASCQLARLIREGE